MITKALFSAAVALGAAVGIATQAGADPSAFGVLSCSCESGTTASEDGPAVADQINEGIQNGLFDLRGIPD
ncbi:hypothetical protein K3U93_05390 [Mycobacterium malmoense]|uniref:Uncharacterized protein n=1 Tax=Mycobacterium malmoense TaxID=1780 RepID=A0ABX3SN38_MYCMA|nr:hypothetical protein [Mycobacterium malmoense]OIN78172.1 hypothetical protein BMG05_24760 [Mycobacterium malmoense]ORA79652.1 hypothetical protein BST29_18590 [Mycobacterium malmoense]QZA18622.1 hypothetical protein K3U93_05390 [Mycobacterium malmoense]UNB95394.1 hypothetical protein H5T25_05380 [Mycobacterium malmoense]